MLKAVDCSCWDGRLSARATQPTSKTIVPRKHRVQSSSEESLAISAKAIAAKAGTGTAVQLALAIGVMHRVKRSAKPAKAFTANEQGQFFVIAITGSVATWPPSVLDRVEAPTSDGDDRR